ncbi:MAG: hypothetical protein U1E43_10225 [Rhodospirillales bacterium]
MVWLALLLLPLLIVLAALDPDKSSACSGPISPPRSSPVSGGLSSSSRCSAGRDGLARLVRAEALRLREETFVMAARALGAGGASWIMAVHILPNWRRRSSSRRRWRRGTSSCWRRC